MNGCGAVFKLAPPAAGTTAWTETTLYKFTNAADGSYPWDAPVEDAGSFYMTSSGDEVNNDGSIIRLTPPAKGGTKWQETTVFAFTNDANGSDPLSTLLLRDGTFYATTAGGPAGPGQYGTVFGFTP